MKTIIKVVAKMLMVTTLAFVSCKEDTTEDTTCWDLHYQLDDPLYKKWISLQGSGAKTLKDVVGIRWKLIGDVDEMGMMREFEPKKCQKCYTLSFGKDGFFSGFSTINEFRGHYYESLEEPGTYFLYWFSCRSDMHIEGDGELWHKKFQNVEGFVIQESELRLHYNENKNYLRYIIQR